MSIVAVINKNTNRVEGMILAEETDPAPEGTYLVAFDRNTTIVRKEYDYDPKTKTFSPNPEQKEQIKRKYAMELAMLIEEAWGN